MRAFVFPGQGAQTIGMGRELAETYPAARDVFDQVDEALGEKLSDLIWNGDIETLTLTPIDRALVVADMLDGAEVAWLNAYHARVLNEITPLVDEATAEWLAEAAAPIS